MAKYIDYYKVLGVSEDATQEEIKKAWINIQKIWHPDLNQKLSEDNKKLLEEYNKLVNNTKEILTDPEQKRIYDIKRNNYLKRKEEKQQMAASQNTTVEETTHEQPKTNQEDILNHIIRTYQEVRKEEKKHTIRERFEGRKSILSNYNINSSTIFNIIGEVGFQLYKLNKEQDEDFTKYTIRNRFNIATAIIVLSLIFGINSKQKEEPIETPIIEVEKEESNIEEKTVLYNYHIVEEGDTLSGLAQRAHISLEELKEFNGIDRDTIYLGEELIIPFSLTDDILQYYTETKEVNNTSLEDIAIQYETDIYSLKILNGEAITEDNIILSNELIVPKFLTENEWVHIKNNTKSYSKVNNN